MPASGPDKASTTPSIQAAKSAPANTYDADLAAAVAVFQARHGINVDSALGKETIESMNVPASYRLGEIAANMERYRWLPRSFGSRYIFVNVSAFKLEAYDSGQKTLEMKVIVGQEYQDKATPVFAGTRWRPWCSGKYSSSKRMRRYIPAPRVSTHATLFFHKRGSDRSNN